MCICLCSCVDVSICVWICVCWCLSLCTYLHAHMWVCWYMSVYVSVCLSLPKKGFRNTLLLCILGQLSLAHKAVEHGERAQTPMCVRASWLLQSFGIGLRPRDALSSGSNPSLFHLLQPLGY